MLGRSGREERGRINEIVGKTLLIAAASGCSPLSLSLCFSRLFVATIFERGKMGDGKSMDARRDAYRTSTSTETPPVSLLTVIPYLEHVRAFTVSIGLPLFLPSSPCKTLWMKYLLSRSHGSIRIDDFLCLNNFNNGCFQKNSLWKEEFAWSNVN